MCKRNRLSARLSLYHHTHHTVVTPSTPPPPLPPYMTASKLLFEPVLLGPARTTSFRIYFKSPSGTLVSPFHSLPLRASPSQARDTVTMVVEVPRHSCSKMEISKDEPYNPIKQDIKKGKLRFVANVFPFKGYPWNYGAIPQTWESPLEVDEHTGFKGDNDPLDVLDISTGACAPSGTVKDVKILGCLGMIDEGETDWKLIGIDVSDPLSEQLNDIDDIEKHCPGVLEATKHWFTVYKVPDGKPRNVFAFNGEFQKKEFALEIVDACHEAWKVLQRDGYQGIATQADGSSKDFEQLVASFAEKATEQPTDEPSNIHYIAKE